MGKIKKSSSFTLIELLVVIVIIGILAGVIAISTSSAITSSQNAKLVANLSNISKALEGYSSYPKDSLCIEDTTKNPNFLSSLGIENYPKHPNYTNGTALTTNNCFLYFSDGQNYSIRTPAQGNNGYLIQESRHPKTQDIVKSCESGWIPFGNRCIMQYEAKCSESSAGGSCVKGTSTLISSEVGTPWVNINQNDAKTECEKIGAHLITNAEWMAIARDIESVKSNWTGGAVGSGILNRGNSDSSAAMDGTDLLSGVNKRTHTLSNGQVIWDFAGNVWEWVDDTITQGEQYINFNQNASNWYEFNATDLFKVAQKLPYTEVGPKETYATPSSNGLGKIRINTSNGSSANRAFLRGGIWSHGANAGVFALSLSASPTDLTRVLWVSVCPVNKILII